MGSQSAEFKQIMSFQSLGQRDIVEIIETVYWISERLVIFFLYKQVIVGIIDSLDIQLDTEC